MRIIAVDPKSVFMVPNRDSLTFIDNIPFVWNPMLLEVMVQLFNHWSYFSEEQSDSKNAVVMYLSEISADQSGGSEHSVGLEAFGQRPGLDLLPENSQFHELAGHMDKQGVSLYMRNRPREQNRAAFSSINILSRSPSPTGYEPSMAAAAMTTAMRNIKSLPVFSGVKEDFAVWREDVENLFTLFTDADGVKALRAQGCCRPSC